MERCLTRAYSVERNVWILSNKLRDCNVGMAWWCCLSYDQRVCKDSRGGYTHRKKFGTVCSV